LKSSRTLDQSSVFRTLNDTLNLAPEAFKNEYPIGVDLNYVLNLRLVITSLTQAMKTYKEAFFRFREQCTTQQLPLEFISSVALQLDLERIDRELKFYDPPHELAIPAKLHQLYSSSKLSSCAYDIQTGNYKVVVNVPIRPQGYSLTLLKLTPLPFIFEQHPFVLTNLPQRVVKGFTRKYI